MIIETLHYKDKAHQKAFEVFIEDMDLSLKEMQTPSKLLRRQFAFLYLLALYQEDYEQYEGERFYVEAGIELSLGGPTYLLEERYGERKRAYEQIISIACSILKGEVIDLTCMNQEFIEHIRYYLDQAVQICEIN